MFLHSFILSHNIVIMHDMYVGKSSSETTDFKKKEGDLLNRLKHFPSLVSEFFKYSLFGLLKLWGSVGLLAFIFILYYTWAWKVLYYYSSIRIRETHYNSMVESRQRLDEKILVEEAFVSCMKNQLNRILNHQNVEADYCNK